MFYLLVVILLALLLFHFWVHNSRKGKIINRLPGPPVLPILGNALQLARAPGDLYKLFRVYGKTYYPIYKTWMFNTALIHIRHPDDLEAIFTSKDHIAKRFGYQVLCTWLNTGLLTSEGEKWHHRRKVLTPSFHFNILKEHMKILNSQGIKIINEIGNLDSEASINLEPLCMKFTLNVICESSMGVSLESETDKEATTKYKKALQEMVYLVLYINFRPYLKGPLLSLTPDIRKRVTDSVYEINFFIDKIIDQRRKYHQSNNYFDLEKLKNQDDFDSVDRKKKLSMIDILLSAERDNLIDHEGVKEEVSTFVFAGHDTTGISLCFTIALLAEHKEVQNQARAEVDEIFERKSSNELELSDLKDMVYLERVIKESLRLYPSVPMIARHMTADLQLKNGLAPKGADLIMHIADVHKDPNYWPNPEKFDPDRFLSDEASKRHPFAYVPFSAGSRNCIGQKFAMMELKYFTALVLHNFYLEPVDRLSEVEIIADAITRPSRPLYTKFIRKNNH